MSAPRATFGWRWVIAIAIGLTLLASWAVAQLRINSSLEVLFARSDPAAQAMASIARDFPITDTLVLIVSVDETQDVSAPARAEALRAYGDALSQAAKADASLAGMIGSLAYAVSPDGQAFVKEQVLAHLPDYLDGAAFAQLQAKLSPQGMAQALRRTEAMLASPGAGGVLGRELARDPLALRDIALPMLARLQPPLAIHNPRGDSAPAIINRDATRMLVTIQGRRPVSDLAYAQKLTQTMQRVAQQVNEAQGSRFTLDWTGGYAIAAHASQAIRHDMIASTITSVLLISLLFLVVFRHPLYFAISFGPMAAGVLWGFGVFSLTSQGLTPVAVVAGAMLAGLGIDYALHVLAHADARGRLPLPIFYAMLAAFLTTLTGFGVILFSDVPAMRQFGLLGMLGLTGAFAACISLLPAMLQWLVSRGKGEGQRLTRVRLEAQPWVGWIAHHARGVLACGLLLWFILAGVIVTGVLHRGHLVRIGTHQRDMHPQPNPPLQAQALLQRAFGQPAEMMMVLIQADTAQAMLTLCHRVETALQALPGDVGVAHVSSLASLLPDPALAAVDAREARLAKLDPSRVLRDFDAAVAQSGFNPQALSGYRTALQAMLQPSQRMPVVTLAQRWPGITQPFLSSRQAGHQSVMYVWLDRSLDDPHTRGSVIMQLRQALKKAERAMPAGSASSATAARAVLTGTTVLAHDTQAMVRQELAWLGTMAAAVVLGMLVVLLRSAAKVMVAVLPLTGSALAMLAWLHASGQGLNLINLISLPLILGIAVDYGIFLVTAAPRRASDARQLHAFSRSVHASTLCCLTTMIGFGSVITVSMPALASLGWLLAMGMAGALAGAWLVTTPLLLLGVGVACDAEG